MDQLKTALAWLKHNYFWISCGLLAAIVLYFSVTSANELHRQRLAGENSIRSAVSTVKNVTSTQAEVAEQAVKVHPNQTTVEGMEKEINEALKVAAQAWKLRRSAQVDLYKWPDVLGTHKKTFEKLPWPELIPPPNYTRGSDKKGAKDKGKESLEIPGISAQVLEVYGREIRKVMPELAAIIGANWKYSGNPTDAAAPAGDNAAAAGNAADSGTAAGSDGGAKAGDKTAGGGVKIKKYVVQWNPEDQDRWYEMVTNFRSISIENRPTLVGAVYIQENLWLLESLFRIIKQVNGDADANDVAAIKSIDHLYFGRDAQGLSGELSPVSQRLFLEARAAKTERLLKRPKAGPKKPVKEGQSSKENRYDPADNRFVDDNYEPISATTVREAVMAQRLGSNAALTVAKRIPFRIGLTMDERKIPAFLAACANSPFRFETRQVRINRHDSAAESATEEKQSSGPGNAAEDTGTSGGNASFSSAGGGNKPAAVAPVSTRTNHDVRVEFYGFVKIYNPVNHTLLETAPETPEAKQATAAVEAAAAQAAATAAQNAPPATADPDDEEAAPAQPPPAQPAPAQPGATDDEEPPPAPPAGNPPAPGTPAADDEKG